MDKKRIGGRATQIENREEIDNMTLGKPNKMTQPSNAPATGVVLSKPFERGSDTFTMSVPEQQTKPADSINVELVKQHLPAINALTETIKEQINLEISGKPLVASEMKKIQDAIEPVRVELVNVHQHDLISFIMSNGFFERTPIKDHHLQGMFTPDDIPSIVDDTNIAAWIACLIKKT